MDSLAGAKYFSSLDLKSGYWQVEMDKESKKYTVFTVGPLGFYECDRMPFGLCNAPATFQWLMEMCLDDLNLRWCLIYLDDIVIFSKTQEEHFECLDAVLQRLIDTGLKLKPSKCDLFKEEIIYLKHRVTSKGIHPDPKGIRAVQEMVPPETVMGVRKFVRLISHYQKFIKGFANIAQPLNKLVLGENTKKKKEKIVWTDECQVVFDKLKEALSTALVLVYADYSKPFGLVTDVSKLGLRATLYQKQDDRIERPIAFASRALSDLEQKYHLGKLEFLALKWAITEKFQEYLYGGCPFEVQTNNKPLMYLLTMAKLDATEH